MALDTKYRPTKYSDVLGQEASAIVLKQFVKEGMGFHQSYVFCGQHGSGKTTLGRILARALLCTTPNEGEPCDECHSCQTLLDGGAHESFEELDAATKSGKSDLSRIIEDVTYSTFSGNRRIYLFDESHRLSKQALDALLKPMEDNVPGTEDKKLVCIFCTTEPEKMRNTIFSRCAPAFVIRAVPPEVIAERLAWICEQESIKYEQDALVTIAEVGECHIRDALKTVEGVSMLGDVSIGSVSSYLQLGANTLALDLIESIGTDLGKAVEVASEMAMAVSPTSAYERVSEAALCAYRVHLGVGKIPSHWGVDRIKIVSERGLALLSFAERFSNPPHRPTRHTFILDVGVLHHALLGSLPENARKVVLQVQTGQTQSQEAKFVPELSKIKVAGTLDKVGVIPKEPTVQGQAEDIGGVWVDPRGIGGKVERNSTPSGLGSEVFRRLLLHHLGKMSGPSGRTR